MNKHRSILAFISLRALTNLIGIARAKLIAIISGVGDVGVLGQLIAFNTFQNCATLFGTATTTVNFVKADGDNNRPILQSIGIIVLAANTVYLALLLPLASVLSELIFDSGEYVDLIYALAALAPIYSLYWLLQTVYQAEKQFRRLIRVQGVSLTLALIGVLPAVYWWGVIGVVYDLMIWYIAGIIGFLPGKTGIFRLRRSDFQAIRDVFPLIVKSSLTVYSRNLIAFGSLVILRILVVQILDITNAGYFQSAWSVAGYINLLVYGFLFYVFPVMSNIDDERTFSREMNINFRLQLYMLGPVLLLMASVSPFMLELLYTEEFVSMSGELTWMIFGKGFEAVYLFYLTIILSQQRLTLYVRLETFKSIAIIVFPYLLLLPFELAGGVAGVIVAQVLSCLLLLHYIQRDPSLKLEVSSLTGIAKILAGVLVICLIDGVYPEAWYLKLLVSLVTLVIALDIRKYRQLFAQITTNARKKD